MALRTRVFGAGKLFVLGGALIGTFLLFAAASMRLAIRAREVQVPDLVNHTANEATAIASDWGLTVRVDESRRPDPKLRRGPRGRPGSSQGIDRAAAAKRPGVAQRRAACRHGPSPDRRDRSHRADAPVAGRPRPGVRLGDPFGGLCFRCRRRSGSAGQAAQCPGVPAREPRGARRQLRHARFDRRRWRACG